MERSRILEKALKSRRVKVREGAASRRTARADEVVAPSMAVATRGFDLADPLNGVRVGEDFTSQRLSGDDLVKGLVRAVRGGVRFRAQSLATIERAMAETTSAFDGYNAVHVRLARALSVCKDMLETLHAAAQAFGEFELPPPTDEQIEQRRAWVQLDDIRGVPPAKNEGQRWESDYAKKQREEANAAWREEREAERLNAGDSDVFTPGGEG